MEQNMGTGFIYTTLALGQSLGLSKRVCLYAGTDWLSSYVSQRVVRGQMLHKSGVSSVQKSWVSGAVHGW